MKGAIFLVDEYLLRRDSGSKVVMEEVPDPNTTVTSSHENSIHEQVQVHPQVRRRSERVPRQPDRYVRHIITNNVHSLHLKDNDPLTYNDVVNDFNSRRWQQAMDYEISSIH